MTDDNQAKRSQNIWMQKGLGWLPDYPDLRDYQLDKEEIQKGGRFSLEETTSNIEGLADSVIKALKLLQETSGASLNTGQEPFKAVIEDLQSKVFGNISFLNVKLRKILRPAPERISEFFPSFSTRSYYQDVLWRQSLYELKIYLHLLFNRGDLKIPTNDESQKEYEEIKQLSDVAFVVQWLKKATFDPITVILLKWFKEKHGVLIDAAVGPFTYDNLSRHLLRGESCICKEKPEQIQSQSLDERQKYLRPSLESIPKVQLVSIPSLIVSDIIPALFQELIGTCTKELKQNVSPSGENEILTGEEDVLISSIIKIESDISEYGLYCEESSGSELSLLSAPYPQRYDMEETVRKWLLKNAHFWFTTISSSKEKSSRLINKDKLFLDRSCKVFNNEFKVIEPLVSIILKLIMPVDSTKHQTWAEAISTGFHQFEKLAEGSDIDDSLDPAEAEFLKFLAVEALQKVRQEIEEGKQLVNGEIPKLQADKKNLESYIKELEKAERSEEECKKIELEHQWAQEKLALIKDLLREKRLLLGSTLYFYFLIKQFVEHYRKKFQKNHSHFLQKNKLDLTGTISVDQGNVFDKRETLEIENPERFYRGDLSSNKNKNQDLNPQEDTNGFTRNFELFPTETLQVPVLINVSRILGLNYLDSQTSGYFFLPGVVDLSFWCTPVEDQGSLKSCTAMAGVALMEYFVNRSRGKYTDLSPLFLYQVAQKQLNLTGDVGASLRETMKAMALHGVPPESVWQYDPTKVNEEPPPFCYSYAQNYQALKYFRLDYAGISSEALLFQIKAVLSSGFPCMFGFTIYSSAYEDTNTQQGWIPFPDAKRDKVKGGHAVVAVGYDDYQVVPRADRAGYTLGAFLIRNCWGKEWGKGGYGWLPYDYVQQGLTYDWWSLLKAEWFEADLLGAGANNLDGVPPYLRN